MSINELHSPVPLPASGSPRLPPAMLAQVGEAYAVELSMLGRELAALGPLPAAKQVSLEAACAHVAALEGLGVRLQEIARVLTGDAPVPTERIALAQAVRQTLAGWSPASEVAAVDVASDDLGDVEVNAAVLGNLLCLALECALRVGAAVQVGVQRQEDPTQPMLVIRVERTTDEVIENFDDLRWALLALLARAVGLVPQRLACGRAVTMMLGFPALESARSGDARRSVADGLPRTAGVAGRHVLLIEPQELARVAAHDLMAGAGLRVDAAATPAQARDGLRAQVPDVVVTGLSIDDESLVPLLDEARRLQPRLRVIQLVDDDNAFAFSAPGANHPAQVGRHNLAQTLVAAVAQELDAAWGP